MSRTSTLIILGLLTVLAPFSGLPMPMRTFLEVVCGAVVAGIGLFLRASEADRERQSAEASLAPVAAESVNEPTLPHGVSPI